MLNPAPNATVQLAATHDAVALQAGRTYSGVVRVAPEGLVALVGRIQIPLDIASGLAAGQRVLVDVQAQAGGLQLTVRGQIFTGPESGPPHTAAPQGAVPQATNPQGAAALAAVLDTIVQAAGRPELAARLAALLPRQTPASEATLRALISTLLSERGAGQDVQQLQQFVARASGEGILTPDTGRALSPWLALTALADSAAWHDLLRRARSERHAASQLARTVLGKHGASTFPDLKNALNSVAQRLLENPAFQSWLRENGQAEAFRALAERTLERATGGDAQNLRALNQPYQFLELPISAEHGFFRLQAHFFSEGGGGKDGQNDLEHRTVLDVETTRLGPVWIDIRSRLRACACNFRMATAELAAAVEAGADELEEALRALGYRQVRVTVSPWDGDRESALIALLAPFQPLDLEA